MKLWLLLITAGLILTGCISMDVDYLDDNYSDRVELAQKILGMDSVYFDTSSYNKTEPLSIAIPVTEINNSRRLLGGGVNALVEQFELIADSYRKITISGNRSSETAKITLTALAGIDDVKLVDVEFLYIGDKEYQLEIRQAVEKHGGQFQFAAMPQTKL